MTNEENDKAMKYEQMLMQENEVLEREFQALLTEMTNIQSLEKQETE